MRRITILNASEIRRKPFNEAKNEFLKHCRIKNLRPRTITCYEEDINNSLYVNTQSLQQIIIPL